mmetsp:Transcript_37320/g.96846  ORF Transcript_37320/g.96846 Transcript_37320/m.96846 type:complete len:277 (-) Transcript_37320:28-858(-)
MCEVKEVGALLVAISRQHLFLGEAVVLLRGNVVQVKAVGIGAVYTLQEGVAVFGGAKAGAHGVTVPSAAVDVFNAPQRVLVAHKRDICAARGARLGARRAVWPRPVYRDLHDAPKLAKVIVLAQRIFPADVHRKADNVNQVALDDAHIGQRFTVRDHLALLLLLLLFLHGGLHLFRVHRCVGDALLVVLGAAIGAARLQAVLSGIFHDLVPAPQAHAVPAVAQAGRLIRHVHRLHAQRACLLLLVLHPGGRSECLQVWRSAKPVGTQRGTGSLSGL